MDKELKQLKFRCCHRGMKEIDILLGGFFENNYKEFSKEDIFQLNKYVISLSDNELYMCFFNKSMWPKNISSSLINKLYNYAKKSGLNNS